MAATRQGAVLVVDDEEIMREILETLLSREGYEVRVAASGAEGLEQHGEFASSFKHRGEGERRATALATGQRGIRESDIPVRVGCLPAEVEDLIEQSGAYKGTHNLFAPVAVERVMATVRRIIAEYEIKSPLALGVPARTLREGLRVDEELADITIREMDTGLERVTTTNEKGIYSAPFLPVGRYRVTAELAGLGTLLNWAST